MTFFQEGGWGMWMTLAFFLGFGVAAMVRRQRGGDKLAVTGAVLTVTSGLLGFSTGIYATVTHLGSIGVTEKAEILSIGIRESANNLTLAAVLAFILAVAATALAQMGRSREDTPLPA